MKQVMMQKLASLKRRLDLDDMNGIFSDKRQVSVVLVKSAGLG